jgi:hypothetical protein
MIWLRGIAMRRRMIWLRRIASWRRWNIWRLGAVAPAGGRVVLLPRPMLAITAFAFTLAVARAVAFSMRVRVEIILHGSFSGIDSLTATAGGLLTFLFLLVFSCSACLGFAEPNPEWHAEAGTSVPVDWFHNNATQMLTILRAPRLRRFYPTWKNVDVRDVLLQTTNTAFHKARELISSGHSEYIKFSVHEHHQRQRHLRATRRRDS